MGIFSYMCIHFKVHLNTKNTLNGDLLSLSACSTFLCNTSIAKHSKKFVIQNVYLNTSKSTHVNPFAF